MIGKHHILCTTAIVSTAGAIHISCMNMINGTSDTFYGLGLDKLEIIRNIDSKVWSFLDIGFDFNFSNLSIKMIISIISFFIFVLIGTLCADCDSKTSIMGKILYIPVEHRTWLHAIWIPLLCTIGGLSFKPAIWFALGWFLHEFMDAFSYEGNSYLYPIVGYYRYGEAKVKKGVHNFKMYRAGKTSERVFVFAVITLCICISSAFLASPYFHIDIVGKGIGIWS